MDGPTWNRLFSRSESPARSLLEAIDKDDDVLTQFHDADDLQQRLGHAVSFDDVVEVLRHAATETDNDR
jgi:hypothetical protein